jgi:glycosyltransferase involved in cell wall biosynthesis
LRILFALSGLHRVTRGAEVAFEELARQIARRPGFEVTLIGSGMARADEPYEYRRAGCIRREWFEKWPSIPFLRDHFGYEELSFVPGLLKQYTPGDFDVTVTCGYPYTNWLLRARRSNRMPRHVFVTQNGDWMVHARQWEYRLFSCDGLVCTNCEYFARNRERYPSVLIPNGVNSDVFFPGIANAASLGITASLPVVLMVSALSASKRVIEGISAVARLPRAHLLVAGDGELRREVQQAGERLLPGRFTLLTLPREKIPELYRAADVFLHMSQNEPSSNAYLEALATGLPIVTHDWPVTRWTFEQHAVLVNTSDEAAVAAGIQRAFAMESPEEIEARRQLVDRRFAWNAIAGQYCDFFEQVVTVGERPLKSPRGAPAQGLAPAMEGE